MITGGAGFIGSNLSLRLIKEGFSVTVVDSLTEQIHGKNSYTYNLIKDKVTFILGDIREKGVWERALEGVSTVVHLAAETGTGQSMYEVEKYVSVNSVGTSILLDMVTSKKYKIKKIVLASSRAVYGEGKYFCSEHGTVFPKTRELQDLDSGDYNCKCPTCNFKVEYLPTDEDAQINPVSIYGVTKYNQEQLLSIISKPLGIDTFILRFQNVYGPGQSLKNPYTGILSIFSSLLLNKQRINIFEDGEESRDFVYIDDVVDAITLCIKSNLMGGVFNVGSGVPITVNEVVKQLEISYNINADKRITGNFRVGDIRHNVADISKIINQLNFNPKMSFIEGIKRFSQWVTNQEAPELNFDKSINEMRQKGMFK